MPHGQGGVPCASRVLRLSRRSTDHSFVQSPWTPCVRITWPCKGGRGDVSTVLVSTHIVWIKNLSSSRNVQAPQYWENMEAQSQRSKGGFTGCTLVAGFAQGIGNHFFTPIFTSVLVPNARGRTAPGRVFRMLQLFQRISDPPESRQKSATVCLRNSASKGRKLTALGLSEHPPILGP